MFLGLFPNFLDFPFSLFFRYFFPFLPFFSGLRISAFPFFGRARFRGIGPPAQVHFKISSHSSPPRPTVTQRESQTRPENASMQVGFCGGPPLLQAFHQCCNRCVVHQQTGVRKRVVSKRVVWADVPRYQKPERGYIRMFPGTKNWNEGTFGCSPVPKTGTRYIRHNRPVTKPSFCFLS